MGDEKQPEKKLAEAEPELPPLPDFLLDIIYPDRPGAFQRWRESHLAYELAKEKPN
jgi:hypothetical protein